MKLRSLKTKIASIAAFSALIATGADATTILYTQNFENPNPGSFVNDSGDVNIFNQVNTLYGG